MARAGRGGHAGRLSRRRGGPRASRTSPRRSRRSRSRDRRCPERDGDGQRGLVSRSRSGGQSFSSLCRAAIQPAQSYGTPMATARPRSRPHRSADPDGDQASNLLARLVPLADGGDDLAQAFGGVLLALAFQPRLSRLKQLGVDTPRQWAEQRCGLFSLPPSRSGLAPARPAHVGDARAVRRPVRRAIPRSVYAETTAARGVQPSRVGLVLRKHASVAQIAELADLLEDVGLATGFGRQPGGPGRGPGWRHVRDARTF